MNNSTFKFSNAQNDIESGIEFFTVSPGSFFLKGVSKRSHNSFRHIKSATFIPNLNEETDYAWHCGRKEDLGQQNFVFLTTEFETAMLYATNHNGRIVTYKVKDDLERDLRLINLSNYDSVIKMCERYRLTQADLKLAFNTEYYWSTLPRDSSLDADYEFVRVLMKTTIISEFDGFVYNANWPNRPVWPQRQQEHHDEVLIFSPNVMLIRDAFEYRFTGLGYVCRGIDDLVTDCPHYWTEMHFLLKIDSLGSIVDSVCVFQCVDNDKFGKSKEKAKISQEDARDKWLHNLTVLETSKKDSGYQQLITMMDAKKESYWHRFNPRTPSRFNFRRFDAKNDPTVD